MSRLCALGASLVIVQATAPGGCYYLPEAFSQGVKTTFGGDDFGIYSTCATTSTATGEVTSYTDINWSGIVASLALCAGAWCLGGWISGLVGRRRAARVIGGAAAVWLLAMVVFFV